jgi:hypothetical protein
MIVKALEFAGFSCLGANTLVALFEACDPFEPIRTELRSFGFRSFDLERTAPCLPAEVFVGRIYDGTAFVETALSTSAGSALSVSTAISVVFEVSG